MADTTPAAFDPKPLYLGHVYDMKAGAAILAGQVVAIHGTGVDYTVHPAVSGTTNGIIGVALFSQSTVGGHVAVAGTGTICLVCEGAGSAVDAGDEIMGDDVAGCVITGVVTSAAWHVGIAITDGSANGTFYALINPVYLPKGA